MKKQSGFTLIELLVAMAVLGLIMGAMVHLFGSSVTSLHVGARQEVVYEEARLLMNELKTTLRYADSINPQNPDDKTTILSYSGTMWNRHMDIGADDAGNIPYDIKVEWQDAGGGLKQLKLTRTDETKDGGSKQKVVIFPQDSANSLFKEGSPFPITSEAVTLQDGSSIVIYKIALPVQYELNGKMKNQTLETKVVPSEDEIVETLEKKMRREYMEILNTGRKIEIKEQLTGKEEKLRDAVYTFFGKTGSWLLTNNDNIRKYMHGMLYNGAWPSVKLTTANGVALSVYYQPVCHDTANAENTFIMGGVQPALANSWVTQSLYHHKRKKWLTTGKAAAVMSENWEALQQWMIDYSYQDVAKVEYN